MSISNLNTLELRKQIEDKIRPILEWEQVDKDCLYKFLHNDGCRTEGQDFRIDKALSALARGDTVKRC